MGIAETLKSKRSEILALATKYGASNVRVFGSVVRGEASPDSDVDLLVSMEKGRSYFDLVGLWYDLEELLGRKVDVVTDGGLSPYLKDRILGEAVPL
ncbi:MAG: nucleotidyltransferase family protein [candidate division Zixibacteria bacterium]|nr:nucleotidyltransferase family protein [candidate division Zixibacteria bacterium]